VEIQERAAGLSGRTHTTLTPVVTVPGPEVTHSVIWTDETQGAGTQTLSLWRREGACVIVIHKFQNKDSGKFHVVFPGKLADNKWVQIDTTEELVVHPLALRAGRSIGETEKETKTETEMETETEFRESHTDMKSEEWAILVVSIVVLLVSLLVLIVTCRVMWHQKNIIKHLHHMYYSPSNSAASLYGSNSRYSS